MTKGQPYGEETMAAICQAASADHSLYIAIQWHRPQFSDYRANPPKSYQFWSDHVPDEVEVLEALNLELGHQEYLIISEIDLSDLPVLPTAFDGMPNLTATEIVTKKVPHNT